VAQPAVADDMGTPFSGLSFSGLEPGGGPWPAARPMPSSRTRCSA